MIVHFSLAAAATMWGDPFHIEPVPSGCFSFPESICGETIDGTTGTRLVKDVTCKNCLEQLRNVLNDRIIDAEVVDRKSPDFEL